MGHLKQEVNSLFLYCSFYDSSGTFYFTYRFVLTSNRWDSSALKPNKKKKILDHPHLHSFLNKEETLQAIGKANAPSVDFKCWQSLWSLKCCKADLAVSGPTLIQSLCTSRHVHVNHSAFKTPDPVACFRGIILPPFAIFFNSKLFPLLGIYSSRPGTQKHTLTHTLVCPLAIFLSMQHWTNSDALVPRFPCKPNEPSTAFTSLPPVPAIIHPNMKTWPHLQHTPASISLACVSHSLLVLCVHGRHM